MYLLLKLSKGQLRKEPIVETPKDKIGIVTNSVCTVGSFRGWPSLDCSSR